MKKTTFITALILVLVLAVGVSTATFAWFSANNVVNISSISFTADSNAGNGDLAVSWTDGDTDSYRIYFGSPLENNDLIAPMMPSVLPVKGVTGLTDFLTYGYFTTGTQVNLENGSAVYQYDGDPTSPYVCRSDTDYENTAFYLMNKNAQLNMLVRVEYEIRGTLSDKLCIALFADGIFQGILTSASAVSYGTITEGGIVASTPSDAGIKCASLELSFTLNANSSSSITLAAWYDGVAMGDSDISNESTLSNLKFRGEFI